jgi:uncharacterized protein (TIGR03118 family)
MRVVDDSGSGAIYKGIAVGLDGGADRLFAADFHNGLVARWDPSFTRILSGGAFLDPTLPAGYAPFNVAYIGGGVYVTYALGDAAGHDDVPGAGHGFVDVFNPDGTFVKRLISGGVLNSPWGLALAPAGFGEFAGDLLVGNFGDGLIHAFDPNTGGLVGTISDATNTPIAIDGVWALAFGNGQHNQGLDTLFFTAGPGGETGGLFGKIDVVPEPAGIVLISTALLLCRRRA